jgi:hypothetical protein
MTKQIGTRLCNTDWTEVKAFMKFWLCSFSDVTHQLLCDIQQLGNQFSLP